MFLGCVRIFNRYGNLGNPLLSPIDIRHSDRLGKSSLRIDSKGFCENGSFGISGEGSIFFQDCPERLGLSGRQRWQISYG